MDLTHPNIDIPGNVEENVVCRVEGAENDVVLTVLARVRAPEVTLNIPRLGYGILEVGREQRIEFGIDNPNPIPAMWTLDVPHPDFTVDMKSGILEPLESAVVSVTWAPKSEYNLQGTVLCVGGAKYSEYAISGRGGFLWEVLTQEKIQVPVAET